MRKLFLISAIMCIIGIVSLNAQDKQTKENSKVSEVTLSCKMHCNDCADKVKKQLQFTKGVKDVKTDLEKQVVVVSYQNDKTDADKLIASLSEIGYTAKIETADKKCPSEKAGGCPNKGKGCGGAEKSAGTKDDKVRSH